MKKIMITVEILSYIFILFVGGKFAYRLGQHSVANVAITKVSTTGDFKEGMNKILAQLEVQTTIMTEQTKLFERQTKSLENIEKAIKR